MVIKELKVNDAFIVRALRHCGYTNYSAVADILDNSLEPEVGSTWAKVEFETENGKSYPTIKSIFIIDDGIGMTKEILEEALSLGSQTGKNAIMNLGCYGAGLKTGAHSIGQTLEVFTKTADSSLNYACLDIKPAILDNEGISVKFETFENNSSEYSWFTSKIGGENLFDESIHGTIVKISNLDRLSCKDYQSFKGTLKNKLGEYFNKFIYSNVVKLYVGKTEVPYTELMGCIENNILMGEGSFEVEGHTIRYKAYYLPMVGGENENSTDETHKKLDNGTEYMERTAPNQGFYVYRNNRLVGKALTFGLWARHSMKNGFRCEIFIDGDCDYLFGSTFTKTISEKNTDTMSQSLVDKLRSVLLPYANEAERRQKNESHEKTTKDPATIKEINDFYKRVTEAQNKNMMLCANRNLGKKDKNINNGKEDAEHKTRGKQTNPNPHKIQKWLGGYVERPLGTHGDMYLIEHVDSKPIVVINTEHPFYQQFYSILDNNLKFKMAQIISCEELAKQKVNYYGSDEVRNNIDCYNDTKSHEVMKSLLFTQ